MLTTNIQTTIHFGKTCIEGVKYTDENAGEETTIAVIVGEIEAIENPEILPVPDIMTPYTT